MREHSFPVILEQMLMVLVFAAAAAVCLKIFVTADQISRENEIMSEAVLLVQNTAEQLKEYNGSPEKVLDSCWQKYTEQSWIYIPEEASDCRIEIVEEDRKMAGLGSARIIVTFTPANREEKVLINVPVAWQETADEQEN